MKTIYVAQIDIYNSKFKKWFGYTTLFSQSKLRIKKDAKMYFKIFKPRSQRMRVRRIDAYDKVEWKSTKGYLL